jgi:hypothetical protein
MDLTISTRQLDGESPAGIESELCCEAPRIQITATTAIRMETIDSRSRIQFSPSIIQIFPIHIIGFDLFQVSV